RIWVLHAEWRQNAVGVVTRLQPQPDLSHLVGAFRSGGHRARLLNGGQDNADQHADDTDDHQDLDQGECGTTGSSHATPHSSQAAQSRSSNGAVNVSPVTTPPA